MKTAFSNLGPNAQKAIIATRSKEYDIKNYKFGDLIPTYSFP